MISGSGDIKSKIGGKEIIAYAVSAALTIAFLYLAFRDINLAEMFNIVSHASIFWIIIFAAVTLFSHFIRAVRWKVMLQSVKEDSSTLNLFGAVMIGYGVNSVIPRLGEVARAAVIGKWENLSRSSMLGTVIIERVIDVLVLAVSVLISVWIWEGDIFERFEWLRSALYTMSFALAIIFIMLYLVIKFQEKFYNLIVDILGRFSNKLAEKAGYIFKMLAGGFATVKGGRNYMLVVFYSALIMLLYALGAYVGFFTLGMEKVAEVNYGMAWTLMTIGAFGIVIPTPGGTGSYHTITKSVLVVLYGFNPELSVAYAFLTHIVSYFIFILFALFFYFYLSKRNNSTGNQSFISLFNEKNGS